jgi:hypothetical protein
VGNLLLVGVVVVVGATVVVLSLGILEVAPEDDSVVGQSTFEIRETADGTLLIPEQMGGAVLVKLNGVPIKTVSPEAVGRRIFIPTAPGDEVTVVSADKRRQVVLRETVARGKAGDFVAYYTFDVGQGRTVVDRSANDNDGSISGDVNRTTVNGEACLQLDGVDDYVTVPQLNTPDTVDVSEFTVAVEYTVTGTADPDPSPNTENYQDRQQLIEHTFDGSGIEWYLETRPFEASPYGLEYAVAYPNARVTSGEQYAVGESHVVVGSYDGERMELYVDGSPLASAGYTGDVEMGELRLGRDFESNIQHLDGCLSELRLYYSALDDDAVDTLTTAME